jgi:hypothetical protein
MDDDGADTLMTGSPRPPLACAPSAPSTDALLPETVLRNYLHAKDENRPHILDAVFEIDAELEIRNHSAAIAFPALTRGRSAIADVAVRSFGQTYENVYTFCLDRPVGPQRHFECGWLVAMTAKAGGTVRVGCGRYDWEFGDRRPHLATRLVITISAMEMLAASTSATILESIGRLDYPWSSAAQVRSALDRSPALEPVRAALVA